MCLDKYLITFLVGSCPGKLLNPSRRRACINHVRGQFKISERHACRALGQYRSTQRRIPDSRGDEEHLVADMIELTRSIVYMATAVLQLY